MQGNSLLVLLSTLLLTTSASPNANLQPNPVEARAAATSPSTAQPGCPSAIGLINGGFESAKLAPWTQLSNSNPTTKKTFVTPGYGGASGSHALKLDFVPANITEFSLEQSTTGKECYGYYYNISYAWNWKDYKGPEGPGDQYCRFSVGTGYCSTYTPHYATRTPGWHHHSYVCRNTLSCHPAYSSFVVDVTCVGGVGANITLPAFTLLVDDLAISNAPGSPNPKPTGQCF